MTKLITRSQVLGEMGETVVKARFLTMGFQFDGRSRLEAGIDGIAEVMDDGRPLAKLIAVQVKAKAEGKYSNENGDEFTYLLRIGDLEYWRGSNLPVIIVLWRQSDDSFYWKEVPRGFDEGERQLRFSKKDDVLDRSAVNRLAAVTVPKSGFGHYIPPLGDGEDALVNLMPITLPKEVYVASTGFTTKKAVATILGSDETWRFDWAIRGDAFWSFHDPRESVCRKIVDVDQVEAIDTSHLAFHEDLDEVNHFAFLLRKALGHQVQRDIGWDKDQRAFYFRALSKNTSRSFSYEASKRKASSDVVNVVMNKADKSRVAFVRHHAFIPRFENLYDQWFLVVSPTYYFTTDGFQQHTYPAELLAGKKRLDKSAALRGQVILWHRFLTQGQSTAASLFDEEPNEEPRLIFGEPPVVHLAKRVPEDVWGGPPKKEDETAAVVQENLFG
ncbi:DUF4365 domain-containing protein [Aquabacter sp. CN5-332]|uniref:DUF4365 domain-containing protein n=1 Tax=Aquabacter sp. CN5-332 TaxID=3156608 RepID=UPI0032B311EE